MENDTVGARSQQARAENSGVCLQRRRLSWLAAGLCGSTVSLLLFACGGKPQAAAPNDTTVTNVSGGPAAPDAGPVAPGNPTTTTSTLGDPTTDGTKLTPTGTDKSDAGTGEKKGEMGRTSKDIQAIVMARRDEARACYDKALAAHPGIEGDIDVKWTIDPDGNVQNVEVDASKSTIAEPSVGKCVVDVIKKIKFNKSDKGFETKTHYPFNFHPKPEQLKAAKDAGAK